jgi:hypothetical protein
MMTHAQPSSESILDAAIECTFPASDPIAIQSAFAAACERECLLEIPNEPAPTQAR